MIHVVIDGNTAKVQANGNILKRLYDYFTVEIPHAKFNPRWRKAMRFGAWDGKAHLMNKFSGRIATGLVPLVQDLYPDTVVSDVREKMDFKWHEKKIKQSFKYKLNQLDDGRSVYQRKAVRRFVRRKVGIVKVATNGGKTPIAAGVIKTLDVPTLYLVSRKVLLHQVSREIERMTGFKCGKIGDKNNDVQKITVAMIQSLPKPIKKNKPFYDQFKLMIMDECQHGSATTWYKIAMIMRAPFKLALSGTPWTGKDDKDLRLISIFGPNILINVKNQYLIKKGWSATPTIHLWPIPYPENTMSWRAAYNTMIVDNTAYNEAVVRIAKESYEEGKPTLLLVNQKRHASRLYKRLLGEEIDCVYLSGDNDTEYREKCLERFKQGKLGCIVATPLFDEGVDVPAIRSLILAGGGKAPIALLQRVGRALRKKSEGENRSDIHDFIHFGNWHLLSHSDERIKIYEQEGFDIDYHKTTSKEEGG